MAAEEETAGGVDEATKQEEETGEDMLTKIFHNYESDVKVMRWPRRISLFPSAQLWVSSIQRCGLAGLTTPFSLRVFPFPPISRSRHRVASACAGENAQQALWPGTG